MRPLSKPEKQILIKINQATEPIAFNILLSEILPLEIDLKIEKESNLILVYTPKQKDFYLIDKNYKEIYFPIIKSIVSLTSFLKYLNEQGYINMHKFNSGKLIGITLRNPKTIPSDHNECWAFPEDEIKEIIFDFVNKSIYPTMLLDNFIANNFKTEEQIRHDQNILMAKIGIGISIILGLVGVFIS